MYYNLDKDFNLVSGTYNNFSRIEGSSNPIKKDLIEDFEISTIFLGLVTEFREGNPVIFETMMFKKNIPIPMLEYRCCTYKEAIDFHNIIFNLFLDNRDVLKLLSAFMDNRLVIEQ